MAGVSISYLNAVPVAISGVSKTTSIYRTLDKLGESDLTRRVVVAGGNYIYTVGFLREISELDGYVDFVKRTAEISEPIVGIYCLDDGLMPNYYVDGGGKTKQNRKELSPLDLRIIATLTDDARRPVSEIAAKVGASQKTVRRHLEDMISDGSLEMNMPVDMQIGGELFLIMHVHLKEGADKREVGKRLLSRSHLTDQYMRTHVNLPNLLAWVFWSGDIKEIRRVLRETSEDKDVHSVMLNFAYLERLYPTWRDKLPEVQTHRVDKVRTRKTRAARAK